MMLLRAPFFTYDNDIEAGLFTLQQYSRLWPKIALELIIPYTDEKVMERYRRELSPHIKLTFMQTDTSLGKGFPSWIKQILQDTQDAWYFFCSSDRYPIALAANSTLENIILKLPELSDEVDAVRLARWKDTLQEDPSRFKEWAGVLCEERPLVAHGLWHPQFVSRRILNWIAQIAADNQPVGMQEFNGFLIGDLENHNLNCLYPAKALIKLEEPTYRGKSTLNFRYRLSLQKQTPPHPGQSSLFWISFSSPSALNRNEFWLKQSKDSNEIPSDEHSDFMLQSLVSRTFPKAPIVIVTYGGCGSKFLLQQLYAGQDKQILQSAHSHWRVPPMNIQKGQKILYLFGDPRNSIISFFQRRISTTNLHGFRGSNQSNETNNTNSQKDWVVRALKNFETDPGPLDEDWDIEAFLNHGVDLFRLEEHFDNWAFSQLPYQVVFCRYESIWNNWEELCEMMDIPVRPLPPKQTRRADWHSLPDPQRCQLNRIYGNFAARLEDYPGLFVSTGTTIDVS